jgi:hypothetical protein
VQGVLLRMLRDVRPRRFRRARETALHRLVGLMVRFHGGRAADSLRHFARPDVQALLDRVGAPDPYEAAAFHIPRVDAEAQLDLTQAFPVVARLHWRPGMGVCRTVECSWTARGVKHAGQLDEVVGPASLD